MKDRVFIRMLKKSRAGKIGLTIMIIVLFLGVFAPLIAPYSPIDTNAADSRMAPCMAHIMGTDETGMDIFPAVSMQSGLMCLSE